MYGYIYETTNLVNGKKYVGKKTGPFNESYKGSGRLIKEAIKKYGSENFQTKVLEWCDSSEELCEKEIYWIKKLGTLSKYGNGYNQNLVSAKGYEGQEHSEDTKNKISSSLKKAYVGRKNVNYGRKLPEKTRLKMSLSKRAEKNSFYNKSHSEETKLKMSETRSGKGNHMYGRTGKSNPKSKKILIVKDGIITECFSTREASRITGVSQNSVSRLSRIGGTHQKTGYTFYYEENYEDRRNSL
ncbi:GIY-YIG nuclease family protein [Geobacillus phage GR1]|nr:GIY-YIG nuclease family protein [Geobacillus phage GR1]